MLLVLSVSRLISFSNRQRFQMSVFRRQQSEDSGQTTEDRSEILKISHSNFLPFSDA